MAKRVGVLGFQGSVEEHLRVLERIGLSGQRIKKASDLNQVEGLIIPGGESTTFLKLLHNSSLYQALQDSIRSGLPVLATCAGIILLAREITQPSQEGMGLLRIKVRRNGYGRQLDSFCEEVRIEGYEKTFRAVFIRAPLIEWVDPEVRVLSCDSSGHPIFVQDGNLWGLTFHPELTTDDRIHQSFIQQIPI